MMLDSMLTLAAILAIFVYGIIAAMLGTILPDISRRFNMTPKQNGNVAMAQAIGLMIGGFFVGPLMDVQGKKIGLVLGLGLVALALFGLRAATGYASVALLLFYSAWAAARWSRAPTPCRRSFR